MKRVIFIILLLMFAKFGAKAQTRGYSDNASGTFVVGLDSYFYGASGSLDFELGGTTHQASVSNGAVSVDGELLPGENADTETVIGVHDFTGNRIPELLVGRRTPNSVGATVYSFKDKRWQPVGQMLIQGGQEIRVFRQVVSIRRDGVLCSWTWHGNKFDYKASDGSPEPSLP